MISPTEKEIVDTFITLLCSQKNDQEKVKQEKKLLLALNTEIPEFSLDTANYFTWQLYLKSNGIGIVGCGSTEFSRLVASLPIRSQTVGAFERLLIAKESEIKRNRSDFEAAFLEWFDKLNTNSETTLAENHLKKVLLTVSHIDRVQINDDVLPLDVYLISRLKPWINRLFLLLENKYNFNWSWAPFVSFGSRWMSDLVSNTEEENKINVIQSRIFSLFTDQSMLFSHAREDVKAAILSCLHAQQSLLSQERLQESLLVLRRSIDMFGNEGVGDMGNLMDILLTPVANELAEIISRTKQTNQAILAIENMVKQWNDALETINCTDTQVRLLDASTSLESLHRLLAKTLPLDASIQYLHEKLDRQATIMSNELARFTEEKTLPKNQFFNNIDMYIRQLVSRIPLIDHTFLESRHIFDEHNGFELLNKEYQYLYTLKNHLKQMCILDKTRNPLKRQISRTISELSEVLDEIALHLLTFVENNVLPEAKKQCIQMIQDFITHNNIGPGDSEDKVNTYNLLYHTLKTLEVTILEVNFAADIYSLRKRVLQFWNKLNKSYENFIGFSMHYGVILEASVIDDLDKVLEEILAIMPNPSVPSHVKAISKIEQTIIPYEKEHGFFTDRINTSSSSSDEDEIENDAEELYLNEAERTSAKARDAEEHGIFTSSRYIVS